MRPKRHVPTAAACALVLTAVAACSGGGSETDLVAETFTFPAGYTGDSFSEDPTGHEADPSADALPAYAVNASVDLRVGKGPSDVAVNPITNMIYVVNKRSDDVTVIDGKTKRTTRVAVGPAPSSVAVNQLTNKIYVTNVAGRDANGAPDTNVSGSVTVIDGATNKTKEIPAGLEPIKLGVNEKTNTVYVANQGSNDVTVIDGKTSKKTATIKLRDDDATLTEGVLSPNDVAINRETNKIYVTGPQSNTVGVIDGKTRTFVVVLTEGERVVDGGGTIPFGLTPTYAAVDEKRNKVYVANFTSNDVTVIDGATDKTSNIGLVDVQDTYGVAVNPITNKIYTANLTSKSVTVIDGETQKSITIGDLPGKPNDVVINPITNKIYFPLFILYRGTEVGDDTQVTGLIAELDGETNAVTIMIAGLTPYAVDVNPKTNKVYVTNQDGNSVTVLTVPRAAAAAGRTPAPSTVSE